MHSLLEQLCVGAFAPLKGISRAWCAWSQARATESGDRATIEASAGDASAGASSRKLLERSRGERKSGSACSTGEPPVKIPASCALPPCEQLGRPFRAAREEICKEWIGMRLYSANR